MVHPLQTKDKQWRGRRRNGATPVFDPGLAPLGSDEEAGGARSPTASDDGVDRKPMPANPITDHGRRLTPGFWYTLIAAVVAVGLTLGVLSIP